MPSRAKVARGLAAMMRAVSHPDRILLIEQLRSGDQSVSELAEALNLPATRLSQHLAVLRGHGLIDLETVGRSHHYHLVQPRLATWLVDGIDFVANRIGDVTDDDVQRARALWSQNAARAN